MPFRSLLFDQAEAGADVEQSQEPAWFHDLNLDQVVRAVINGRGAYNLAPFFYSPLTGPETVRFRQEIFEELERPQAFALVTEFAKAELVAGYAYQARELRDDDMGFRHFHRQRAFLNAAARYCDAVVGLASGLDAVGVEARGLRDLRDYLVRYLSADAFCALASDTRRLEQEFSQLRYSFLLKGNRITVGPFAEDADYSADVTATFERFRQAADSGDRPVFRDWEDYAAIGVLQLVAKVYPKLFAELEAFCVSHTDYLDHTIAVFDRELQFYLSYLDYIRPLRETGLSFSYPRVSAQDKAEQALDTFDLALAAQLNRRGALVVCNDLRLVGEERVLVISGPNNGGKTTLARTVGQLHHLARLGCPVPGRDTQLFLCDRIFTHFERREDGATLSGKLQDELEHLHDAFELSTPDSLFILNEVFTSTTAQDALLISSEMLSRISELDALCVCVTFLDELATLNEKTVSMVSTVDPKDAATRTYKLVRKPADGRAYAHALAEKYGLTYDRLVHGGAS